MDLPEHIPRPWDFTASWEDTFEWGALEGKRGALSRGQVANKHPPWNMGKLRKRITATTNAGVSILLLFIKKNPIDLVLFCSFNSCCIPFPFHNTFLVLSKTAPEEGSIALEGTQKCFTGSGFWEAATVRGVLTQTLQYLSLALVLSKVTEQKSYMVE